MADTTILHNEAKLRFEAGEEPYLAVLDYRLKGDAVEIVHTEVPDVFQRQGVAGQLTASALQWARQTGLKVIPTCPYAKAFIRRHPEYRDLL